MKVPDKMDVLPVDAEHVMDCSELQRDSPARKTLVMAAEWLGRMALVSYRQRVSAALETFLNDGT